MRSHPSADALVQQNVLGVERLELGVFGSADFLGHEVICPQVECQADNANRTHPQTHDWHKQHEEVQPALVGEGNTEDLTPEAVGRDHTVGLFRLGRVERPEGVGFVAIFKQGVLDCGSVNRAQQGSSQHAGYSHHVEGVQRPVVEALQEQQEAEDCRYAEAGSKEPRGLSQGVHQEDADEYGNGSRESDGVVGTDAYKASDFKLPQHEANQTEGSVQRDKRP